MAKVLVPLADGVEEMEAVIIVDVLRRAGWSVVTAGFHSEPVKASRGVRLIPDTDWSQVNPASFDVLMLPGGAGGAKFLASHSGVLSAIRDFAGKNKWIGAICAAPLVLQAAGILQGRAITCHPAVRAEMKVVVASDQRVVIDRHLVTSQGPGTAMEFALDLIRLIDGAPAADKVAAGLVL